MKINNKLLLGNVSFGGGVSMGVSTYQGGTSNVFSEQQQDTMDHVAGYGALGAGLTALGGNSTPQGLAVGAAAICIACHVGNQIVTPASANSSINDSGGDGWGDNSDDFDSNDNDGGWGGFGYGEEDDGWGDGW